MPLVSINDISIRFQGPNLLDNVTCNLDQGQRIGLMGRNGAGKSTLLKIISGKVEPDNGQVLLEQGATIALLSQDLPQDISGPIPQIIKTGIENRAGKDPTWSIQNKVDQIISRMELDPGARFETQSSGMKRRVLLAKALVSAPDLLLLDEPTNHLDIESIQWLETYLLKWRGTILFVTHDRRFLKNLATRILEVDRGKIFDWSCNYEKFLERKNAAIEAEEKQNALFDKKLAEEESWIRQGIKARRKRNQGRVRALKQLRHERTQRRNQGGKTSLQIESGKRSGNLIAKVEEISFAYENKPIVNGFSTEILRGDKVGLIGPNGSGKTTLLNLFLGKLKPQSGGVRIGTNLEIAYFDQLRHTLDESQTVQHNIADGYETINLNGRSKHVLGYLQDFLFPPERARTEVKFLSGGERNRLLLARLFAKTANVLVLDEPTNDLDTETLELLEEKLVEFAGTVLLVSHDRAFLNNVATSTIAFENGLVKEYVGGYDDWQRQSQPLPEAENLAKVVPVKNTANRQAQKTTSKKLSYREQKELETLPTTIEQLESKIAALHETMASPEFYQQPGSLIATEQKKLESLTEQLDAAFERWEDLEANH